MFRALVILASLVSASAFAPIGRNVMRSSMKVKRRKLKFSRSAFVTNIIATFICLFSRCLLTKSLAY